MLTLFRAKFACILAILHTLKLEQFIPCQISNRECEELLKFVQKSRDSRLDLTGGSRLQATRMMHTCQACQKSKRRASCCTTGQKSQAGQAVCSRLELATQPIARSSGQNTLFGKIWLFTSLLTLLYIYPYTHDLERASRKNLREKP